ncbi:hypothetical protein, partial [Lonsdalea populi]|uniref:hypothetical protein n=1 Tax=Lonsdalea populi TaxID=1172565 RepID=UPI001C660FCF
MSKKINDHLDVTPEVADLWKSTNEVIHFVKSTCPCNIRINSLGNLIDLLPMRPNSKIKERSVLVYEDSTTFFAFNFL